MIELIIGMAAAIAVLITIVFAMRSSIKAKNKVIKQSKATIKAIDTAHIAINKQIEQEQDHEESNADAIKRRDYFTD